MKSATRTRLIAAVVVIALALVGAVYASYRTRTHTPVVMEATPREVDPTSLGIYSNGEYGFSLFYPATAILSESAALKEDSIPWRTNGGNEGVPVLQIALTHSIARIGIQVGNTEKEDCLKASQAEKELPQIKVGSTTWSVFTFNRLGTEQEVKVTSYRTMHKADCVAFETFEPLSSTLDVAERDQLSALFESITLSP